MALLLVNRDGLFHKKYVIVKRRGNNILPAEITGKYAFGAGRHRRAPVSAIRAVKSFRLRDFRPVFDA